jgi:hypothetical protein
MVKVLSTELIPGQQYLMRRKNERPYIYTGKNCTEETKLMKGTYSSVQQSDWISSKFFLFQKVESFLSLDCSQNKNWKRLDYGYEWFIGKDAYYFYKSSLHPMGAQYFMEKKSFENTLREKNCHETMVSTLSNLFYP